MLASVLTKAMSGTPANCPIYRAVLDYTPHMIHNYRAVIDHPDFLEDKTDKNKLLFTDFIRQMQTCIIYYHNLTATVKPGGIRQLD